MKQWLMTGLMTALALLLCGGSTAAAQTQGESKKNIYYDYGQPAAKPNAARKPPARGCPGALVKLELKRNDKVSYVAAASTFYDGDRVRLHIRVNRAGYLTILNRGTTGDLQLLYPKTRADAAQLVTKTVDFTIPTTPGNWLKFDEMPGVERMIIILSAQPSHEVLRALAGRQPASAPAQEQEVVELLNSKSFGDGLAATGKDFTETSDETDNDGNPATFVISTGNNTDLRRPVIYKLALKHAQR